MADKERCGFCFQQDMMEPKKMPCGHVYCLECLELHTENPDGVDCAYKYCQGFCANGQLKELPNHAEAETVKPEQNNNKPSDLLCDCNGCEGEKAVKYCVDCGSKLCLFHHKHHPAYFKEKHHIICISKYETSPESFPTPECEFHGGKLHLACEDCQKMLCSKCYLFEKTCKGEVRNHSLKDLQKFQAELEGDYKQLIDYATENLTTICKEEKKTWTYHDQIQDKYDEMIKEVEERTEQQIRDLQQQADQVKAELNDEKEKITQKTVEKLSDLVMRREELEVYRLDATGLLEDAHISEKMRQRETITEKIETVTSKELGRRDIWCDKAVLYTGQAELSVSLSDVPESLEFLSSVSPESSCYTLEYRRATEDLLLGCKDGLQQLNQDGVSTVLISKSISGHTYVCPVEHKGKVYLSYELPAIETSEDGDDCESSGVSLSETLKVCVCEYDIESKKEKMIFTSDGNPDILTLVAVSEDYIGLPLRDPQMKLYDRNSGCVTIITVPGFAELYHIKFLFDGSLLVLGGEKSVTDDDDDGDDVNDNDDVNDDDDDDETQDVMDDFNSKLAKFRIDDDPNLVELWSRKMMASEGIAEGISKLLYVGGHHGTISVLSPNGVLLRVMSHKELPGNIRDICVRGDELAVANNDPTSTSVCLFKIK